MKKKDNTIEDSPNLGQHLLKSRVVMLAGAIDNKLAAKAITKILFLEQNDPKKEIRIFINSPGGEVDSGFAIFDVARFVSCPISTIVCGLAASMGSLLALVGDKGHCYSLPHSRIMIHQPMIGSNVVATASDIDIHTKQILATKKLIAEVYAQKTSKDMARVMKDIDRDHWLNAEEAKKYGLVDRIITHSKELGDLRKIK